MVTENRTKLLVTNRIWLNRKEQSCKHEINLLNMTSSQTLITKPYVSASTIVFSCPKFEILRQIVINHFYKREYRFARRRRYSRSLIRSEIFHGIYRNTQQSINMSKIAGSVLYGTTELSPENWKRGVDWIKYSVDKNRWLSVDTFQFFDMVFSWGGGKLGHIRWSFRWRRLEVFFDR